MKNPTFALKAFQAAVEEKTDYRPALEKLAEINLMLKDYNEATKWFRKILIIEPHREKYWEGLAKSYYLSGCKQKAAQIDFDNLKGDHFRGL